MPSTTPTTTSFLSGTGRGRTGWLKLKCVRGVNIIHLIKYYLSTGTNSYPPPSLCLQCSNESVFGVDFHPTDCSVVVTCGKSHLYFWSLEKGVLVKKQGLFEVRPRQTAADRYRNAMNPDSQGLIRSRRLVWGGVGGCELILSWNIVRIGTFLVFPPAETREAQVRAVRDVRGKWKHHHRRLEREHSGVGKRHVDDPRIFRFPL